MEGPIILYDGVCGLCNGFVQFVLKRDRAGLFRFAALQSPFARTLLAARGIEAEPLDTLYVVLDRGGSGERLLCRSKCALFVLGRLGWGWKALSFFGVLPSSLLDPFYDFVARNRYRWFGKFDACALPPAEWRARFLDQGSS